jgi:hypothetical protein
MKRAEAKEYIELKQHSHLTSFDYARYEKLKQLTNNLLSCDFIKLQSVTSIEELDAKGGITYED